MSEALWVTGDTLDVLRKMPDGCVDLVMTSPPFLALRSYLPADDPNKGREIGQEATPGAFLDVLLDITEECARVLAPHGSLCVELGDTYSGSGGAGGDYGEGGLREGQPTFRAERARSRDTRPGREGTATSITPRPEQPGGHGWPLPKSLALIPESYRFALAYGRNPHTGRETDPWRVRNVVRWCRPNPPVGALGDKFRPATSEMVVACKSGSRWFDLDAVREEPKFTRANGSRVDYGTADRADTKKGDDGEPHRIENNPAGAPPLDWWEIPTSPENVWQTDSGVLIAGGGESDRRVRVRVGVPGDGIQRTASPGCPVHGSPDHPGSSGPDGGRAGSDPTRSARSGDRPAPARADGWLPTLANSGLWGDGEDPADLAATRRSSASNRTGRAPSTSPADTPSARTTPSTDGTSGRPASSVQDPDTAESSTAAGESGGSPDSRTAARTAGTPDGPDSYGACTCSYWIDLDIPQDTSDYAGIPPDWWDLPTRGYPGQHYATYPEALCVRPIKAMCPLEVCTVCGEPRRRIVGEAEYVPSATNRGGVMVADADRVADGANQWTGADGEGRASVVRSAPTLGWTDCGHDAYRPGRVLDIFAGSGTTLAVATGHGRTGIGIDLDARNATLAEERIGPMFFNLCDVDELAARLT